MDEGGAAQPDLAEAYKLQHSEARERIRKLREKLLIRDKSVGRWKGWMPASTEVPRDGQKAEAERTVFAAIANCLFDSSTLVPLSVEALHKKVGGGLGLVVAQQAAPAHCADACAPSEHLVACRSGWPAFTARATQHALCGGVPFCVSDPGWAQRRAP
jgi:hypothetical protein